MVFKIPHTATTSKRSNIKVNYTDIVYIDYPLSEPIESYLILGDVIYVHVS